MKKDNFISSTLLLVFSLIIMGTQAQITVSKVENSNKSSSNGFYYSLSQTVFKIGIVYEKIQFVKGPFSSYAKEYLGVTDIITSDKIEYNLIKVNATSTTESDANQIYNIQFPSERAKDSKSNTFILSDIGGLLTYNTDPVTSSSNSIKTIDQTFIFKEGNENFPYLSQYNKSKRTDTVVRTINIDTTVINRFLFKTSWVDKSKDEKAKEAALFIEKIRESRYNLITGYQEVNYGSSIIYMDEQLQSMEKQYLELFTGKTIKTVEKRTVYFIPEKSNNSTELLKLNDGKSIVARINPLDKIGDLDNVASSVINSVYYRIPVTAELVISSGNVNFFNERFLINQLGIITTAPLDNTELQFDTETGNLIMITRD